ncbi:Uncharacterized protein PCOAH_00013300 [Plasmodium coatneyi]|uniref:Plasmodium RESA N-terminal domain-containing protein n=1 Tax=Plasmodium coatneyi TaxID=208452 RepID=A0A1B1DW12_9APIC|nr:Uncharacterized protein PCOAH_00013300 [Plasmodium coatneyi]ANQ06973.1 Uncharacterized protein PCOAH_00013300 [Plasmodium coatneyi]
MALRKSPAKTNASECVRQNAENEGFSIYNLRTRAFFGASFFALLYILLLNICTCESGNNGLSQLLLNHRRPRSLCQRIRLTTCGPVVTQDLPNPCCKKRNNKPLPGESVEEYLDRSCGRVELTDEMMDKLKSCDPDITEEVMCAIYSTLYSQYVSNFRDLMEYLCMATSMLADIYEHDKSFQNKCWLHQHKKLGKELIKLSDKDDQGFKQFLKETKICTKSDFVQFLDECMNRWNDFIKKHKDEAYAELTEAFRSGKL